MTFRSNLYDLCDPPIPVVVHDGLLVRQHTSRFPTLTQNIASLLPEVRPKDLTHSLYFRENQNPEVTIQRCKEICDLIDSIISDGIATTDGGWNYRDANGKPIEHSHKTWCGPIGFLVGNSGEIHFCDGHHRKTICCLLNIPFPAFVVAISKKWKKRWKSYDWLDTVGISVREP